MITRNPQDVHQPLARSAHQIEVGPGGRWLVLSGQIGMRLDGTVPEDPVEQFTLALENIGRNLSAAGLDPSHLVKLTFYLVGTGGAEGRRDAMADFLGEHHPCMTMLFVSGLADPALRVEIDAWAHADEQA